MMRTASAEVSSACALYKQPAIASYKKLKHNMICVIKQNSFLLLLAETKVIKGITLL